jgi:CDP-diacylglycerol--glycerol-3-phosphate 3-phosphatidyltransferase
VNLPNKITVSRFLASVVLFVLLVIMDFMGDPGWIFPLVAMVLFILVVSTDALDGFYARKYDLVTDFGRIADPVVDKIMICGTFILLSATPWGARLLPAWLVVLIVAREFMVSGIRGFIESRGIQFGSNWAGKGKMIAQSIAIPAVFFYQVIRAGFPEVAWTESAAYYLAQVIIWATLMLTLYSGFLYVSKAAEILKKEEG